MSIKNEPDGHIEAIRRSQTSTHDAKHSHDGAHNHDDIAVLAYHIWMDAGCREGTAEDDWQQAEQRIRENKSTGRTSAASAS